MPFNVDEMLGVINRVGGLSKANRFLVQIIPPQSLLNLGGSYLEFLCDSAALPGVSWTTDEIKMFGYGNIEKRPYGSVFTDIPLTFFNDSDGRVLKFFHQWMQSVYNFNDSTNPNATAKNLFNNTFAYPKEYYGNMEIYHFSDSGEEIINYTLNEAFPIAVQDIQVDWNQESTLLKVPVTFSYTYWSAQTLDPGNVDYMSESRANSIGNLRRVVELLNIASPLLLQRQTNMFASPLSVASHAIALL